ncbi:MAG: trypsin-like peptidase domain-containing protein [Candidatus Gracilibacteria bacterium]|nr:trypsin-like peptidase domain-containing protein [Candidatus Gracilibacteria bacterium]
METNIENKLHDIGKIVFKITTSAGSGSGFYVNKYKILVTNYHVVKGFKQLCVEDNEKNRYLGDVVFINSENDIAFIRIENFNENSIELEFGDSNLLNTRDDVYVLGYPFGLPYTITKGIVSSKNQLINGKNLVQTDAAINPGNSGGAMVNKDGKLIGITVLKIVGEGIDNIGFGIPIDLLNEDLSSLGLKNDDSFCIKCNSCKSLIYEKASFCKICGSSIDKELFDDFQMSSISRTIENEIIKNLGFNPVITRINQDYWTFYYEKKIVRINVDYDNYILFSSPIFKFPKENLEEFYKYCLGKDLGNYKIGIYEDEIYLLYTCHISDILGENVGEYILDMRNFFEKLKEIINYLQTNFNLEGSKYDKKQ